MKADVEKNGRGKFKNQLKRFLKMKWEGNKNAGLDTITEPNVRLPYSNTGPLVGLPETYIEPKVKVQNPDTYAGPEVEIPETHIEPKDKVQNPDKYAGPKFEIPLEYVNYEQFSDDYAEYDENNQKHISLYSKIK